MARNPNIKHWKNKSKIYICMGEDYKGDASTARTLKDVSCKNCIKLLKARK